MPARHVEDHKWWTLTAVCVATFMLLIDITIVNVALPDIARALHSSFSDLQWVIDAYALSLAALLLTWGATSDRRWSMSDDRCSGLDVRGSTSES